MKKVTMQNIADALGITKMSVSKCFQDSDDISPELKKRIHETASQMGYIYKKRIEHKVTVLLSERFLDPSDKFYSGILQKLNAMSDNCQMSFSIQIVSRQDEQSCRLPKELEQAEGILLLGQIGRNYVYQVQKLNRPTVCVDFEWWDIGLDAVVSDSYRGSYTMTMYLIENGHRKIAFVGNLNSTNSIDDRYWGYRKALLQGGIPYREEYLLDEFDSQGNHLPAQLPADMPTAFVCNNDFCAFLLIKELQSAGYRVPQDVSVVGFDNMLYARVSNPEITTMNVPIESMATRAVKQLGRRIADPQRPVSTSSIGCDLIIRNSVAVI